MGITPYAFPALLALVAKAVIFFYARSGPQHNLETRLYLWFLFALSIQNLAEIGVFANHAGYDIFIYYSASIAAIAIVLHLALALGFDWQEKAAGSKWFHPSLIYFPAVFLEALLWLTDTLVIGVEPQDYTYTKIPGPLYFLFEIYTLAYLAAMIALLVRGGIRQTTPLKRSRARLILAGITPVFLVVVTVVTLQRFGLRAFNTTITLPIAITFFLAVTAYATHQYRLFDIAFYVPWSKVRAHKTAFYDRIRAVVAELADLGSVVDATNRLADTLRCPVALLGSDKPVLAVAGGGQPMAAFPPEELLHVKNIVVAREIAEASPKTYALMRSHGVAAIVPFYPHSQGASGWMLLGDAFSEQVYTSLDFKMVEQLFDKMAELFLDKLLFMRNQLAMTEQRSQDIILQLRQIEADSAVLRHENELLSAQNEKLRREQAVDSMGVAPATEYSTLPSITLLGRDKPFLNRLRTRFPQVNQYVNEDSAGFRRQNIPEILVYRVEDGADADALLAFMTENKDRAAFLLYGAGAHGFAATSASKLNGVLVEVLPEDANEEAIARRIQALAMLRRAVRAVPESDCPLVGISEPFTATMREMVQQARFTGPLIIESRDDCEVHAVVRYLHTLSGRKGTFDTWQATTERRGIEQAIEATQDGTLLVTGLGTAPAESRRQAVDILRTAPAVELIVALPETDATLRLLLQATVIRLPTLRERRLDMPLLVHYFTLQYNLLSGTYAYLAQVEVDDWMDSSYPEDLTALKTSVFDRLTAKRREVAPAPDVVLTLADRTLDEHVAAFEARLIEQTLKSCQGNKARAARRLGLRPNTLHYKLERHGLSSVRKDKSDAENTDAARQGERSEGA